MSVCRTCCVLFVCYSPAIQGVRMNETCYQSAGPSVHQTSELNMNNKQRKYTFQIIKLEIYTHRLALELPVKLSFCVGLSMEMQQKNPS